MIIIKDLLDVDLIPDIIQLYRTSTNSVIMSDGIRCDRYTTPGVGHFMYGHFTQEEMQFVWDNIKDKLPEYTPEIFRILRYRKNNYVDRHTDISSKKPEDNPTTHSLIIQLSDPENYEGGEPIVGDNLVELSPGDAVLYHYSEEHEVKRVRKGVRFVVNIRLFKQDS